MIKDEHAAAIAAEIGRAVEYLARDCEIPLLAVLAQAHAEILMSIAGLVGVEKAAEMQAQTNAFLRQMIDANRQQPDRRTVQ